MPPQVVGRKIFSSGDKRKNVGGVGVWKEMWKTTAGWGTAFPMKVVVGNVCSGTATTGVDIIVEASYTRSDGRNSSYPAYWNWHTECE